MSGAANEHRREAAAAGTADGAGCGVLTISDSRSLEDDRSGDLIVRLVEAAGHRVVDRRLVPDDPHRIAAALDAWIAATDVRVVLTTGGTGIAPRDTAVEVVRRRLTHELDGFGELFRALSFEKIRAAAMLSRAVGGLVASPDADHDTLVFSMPGSPHAVELALTELILPELPHMLWLRQP